MIARRVILLTFALVILLAAGVSLWTRHQVVSSVLPSELNRLAGHAALLGRLLETRADASRADAVMISNLPQSRRLGASAGDDTEARKELEHLFTEELRAKPWLLQLRVIAADDVGMELVRVDRERTGEPVRVVPTDQLQAKGQRAYVQRGLELRPGEEYLTPLEPNIERNEPVLPYQPVIRAVAPVFDDQGVLRALVVVNVDMEPLLATLSSGLYKNSKVYVVDQRGNYIWHPTDRSRIFSEWSESGTGWRTDFPQITEAGRFTGMIESRDSGHDCGVALVPTRLEPGISIIKAVPRSELLAASSTGRAAAFVSGFLALLAAMVVVLVFSLLLAKPLHKLVSALDSYGTREWDLSKLPRKGEFAKVASAFERLAATVKKRTEELESEIAQRAALEEELRVQVEAEREAEERLRTVIEACPNGMLVVNEKGDVILVNEEIERLFGYTRSELIARNVDILVPAGVRGAHVSHRAGFMQAPEARLMGAGRDLYGRRKDGSQIAVEIGLRPLMLSGARVVLASVVDVTARKAEAERVASYANQLEVSNKELEKFAYVVSHDLKAPLRGISSVAKWIAEDFGPMVDDESRENLDLLLERTNRLGLLIDGILAYSRAGRELGTATPVNTRDLVEDIVDSIEIRPAINVEISGDFPTVQYNEVKLRQVFQNLIDNAAKHLGKPAGQITVSCTRGESAWTFEVSDNGVGIPKRHYDRIFELFQTLRPKDESGTTGAGLAIAKRIVESNGGEISLSSREGEGTTFRFTIPYVHGIKPQAEVMESSGQ